MSPHPRGVAQAILGAAVVLGFFTAFWIILHAQVEPALRDVVMVIAGNLSAKFGSVVDYFFGSSSGSAEKTRLMAQKDQQ